MSEYELLDVIATYQSTATSHFMNFVTVLFGYLICAFLVGERLTRLQVATVNFLYSTFAVISMMLCYLAWDRFVYFTNELLRQFPQPEVFGEGGPPDRLALYIVSVLFWGFLAGLFFMWTRRRVRASGHAE